jgi:branched-chain amino acid aminotransferase
VAVPKYAFFKGHIVPYSEAKVGVLTHTLNYGTGVFGGLRGYWNDEEEQSFIFRPEDHYRRFLQSTKMLCMDLPYTLHDLAQLTAELLRKENLREDCYIRPLAYFADEIIGVRLHDMNPDVTIMAMPFGLYVENDEGAHVTVSSWRRVDDNSIPARGKISGAYVNSAFVKTEALRAGFDEAIVLNNDGHLSEGSAANVFVVRDGQVLTPPVTDNILEGVVRRSIMELLREEMGVDVVERSIDRTELFIAEEAFFSGTGVQITAITRVNHRSIGEGVMGPLTTKLRELFFNVVRGRVPKYRHWCAPVFAEPSVGAVYDRTDAVG